MNPQTQMPATVVSKSLDHGDEWAVVDVEMRCAPRISVMQDALWSRNYCASQAHRGIGNRSHPAFPSRTGQESQLRTTSPRLKPFASGVSVPKWFRKASCERLPANANRSHPAFPSRAGQKSQLRTKSVTIGPDRLNGTMQNVIIAASKALEMADSFHDLAQENRNSEDPFSQTRVLRFSSQARHCFKCATTQVAVSFSGRNRPE